MNYYCKRGENGRKTGKKERTNTSHKITHQGRNGYSKTILRQVLKSIKVNVSQCISSCEAIHGLKVIISAERILALDVDTPWQISQVFFFLFV